jgi:hypothetical protein
MFPLAGINFFDPAGIGKYSRESFVIMVRLKTFVTNIAVPGA